MIGRIGGPDKTSETRFEEKIDAKDESMTHQEAADIRRPNLEKSLSFQRGRQNKNIPRQSPDLIHDFLQRQQHPTSVRFRDHSRGGYSHKYANPQQVLLGPYNDATVSETTISPSSRPPSRSQSKSRPSFTMRKSSESIGSKTPQIDNLFVKSDQEHDSQDSSSVQSFDDAFDNLESDTPSYMMRTQQKQLALKELFQKHSIEEPSDAFIDKWRERGVNWKVKQEQIYNELMKVGRFSGKPMLKAVRRVGVDMRKIPDPDFYDSQQRFRVGRCEARLGAMWKDFEMRIRDYD